MQVLTYAKETALAQGAATGAAFFSRVHSKLDSGLLNEALDMLFDGLEQVRNSMEAEEWLAFAGTARTDPRLNRLLQECPLTRRAFAKPRGYAGDAVMMDYAYGIHFAHEAATLATGAGRAIFRYIQKRPAVQAVRDRREHIARLIDGTAAGTSDPSILAMASGHLREAELSMALASGRVRRLIALDADAESLREVETRYSNLGVQTTHASVRHILARKVKLPDFQLVYAAGLYDYLNDAVAIALTSRLFELTRPGGQLLIPNFAPCCPDRAYMETFMAWDLIYRDEFDMTRLVARIPSGQIASYDVYSDASGSIVYLLIRKEA